jgi:hypothetical protein
MVLVDDVLMFPFQSILWIFREIYNAAQEEMTNEADSITTQLSSLYMRLETGRITEAEFDAEEKILLERLDKAQERGQDNAGDEGEEDFEEQDDGKKVA